jgi:hypothetical protein
LSLIAARQHRPAILIHGDGKIPWNIPCRVSDSFLDHQRDLGGPLVGPWVPGPGIFFAAFRRALWPFRQGPHLPVIISGARLCDFSDEASSTVGSSQHSYARIAPLKAPKGQD